MSYLVDALNKAERERQQQRGADMYALAGAEAHGRGRGAARALRWIVTALVVCNLGLLLYLAMPDEGITGGPAAPAVAVGHAPAQPLPPAAKLPGPQEQRSAATPTVPNPDRRATQPQRAPAPVPDSGLPDGPRFSSDLSPSRGRVTYSPAPLDDRRALPSSNQENAPTMQDLGGSVPQVTINGHLYSSVPGRSFVLINGRRYHEGERLAAGPAVESIDVRGATLNYRGQRYHVNGPG